MRLDESRTRDLVHNFQGVPQQSGPDNDLLSLIRGCRSCACRHVHAAFSHCRFRHHGRLHFGVRIPVRLLLAPMAHAQGILLLGISLYPWSQFPGGIWYRYSMYPDISYLNIIAHSEEREEPVIRNINTVLYSKSPHRILFLIAIPNCLPYTFFRSVSISLFLA